MTTSEALDRLKLYNQKANEINEHSFTQRAFNSSNREDNALLIEFSQTHGIEAVRIGAEGDSLQSLKILYRLFTFKGRGRGGELMINFINLPEIYEALPQVQKIPRIAEKIGEVIAAYEKYVSSTPGSTGQVQVTFGGQEPTIQEIVDVFLYADDFHMDADKRKKLLEWKEVSPVFHTLEHTFVVALATIIDQVIMEICRLNALALEDYEKHVSINVNN